MPKKIVIAHLVVFSCFISLISCSQSDSPTQDMEGALASIDTDRLLEHVKVLGSDEFEGRSPSSPGEDKTVKYLEAEFKKVGANPGNGDSYFQEVPLVEITADPKAILEVTGGTEPMTFSYGDEFVGWTLQAQEKVSLEDSELVFVGYGIVAPEHNWDDYEGVDVKGKTVVTLVNDPGFTTEDPALFSGRAMTYYGRWTYKYEEAARQGAAGAIIIHETEPAAYDWDVVKNSWTGPRFSLRTEDGNASRCAVESWMTLGTTQRIFEAAGMKFEEVKAAALKEDFKAIGLGLAASVTIESSVRESISRNVAALVPGSNRADEAVIYTAHWDHFGKDPNLEGDQIYNGALDNATGTAALILLADAFKKLGTPTGRSILFLAVTAEEQGLLGSHYYATHPFFPLNKTAGVINMDSLNIYGRMKDVRVIGYGQSELEDYAKAVAAEQDRVVLPNSTPEKGSFYRSDHFPFAKQGVPALSAGSGIDHREKGEAYGRQLREQYGKEKYHKPTDEYDESWNLEGAMEDLDLYFKIGHRLAMEATFPNWKEGSEFKARRDADMGAEQ